MKSETLDNMTFDEVLARVRCDKVNKQYWMRVASCKLAEYRRTMPKLARFIPDCNWRGNLKEWETELAAASR